MTLQNTTDRVAEKLSQALALHQNGKLAHARALYEKILKVRPLHFDALHLLGVIAAQSDKPDRAVTLISRAIEIDPTNADAHCNLGSAHKALNQLEAALRSYDRAIALRPAYAEVHCCRATVLHGLRRLEEALRSCDRALELNPRYAPAHCARGHILGDLRQLESALACFDHAIAVDSRSADAHNGKGLLLRQMGQRDAALACFERALCADPDFHPAHLNRGNVFMDLYRLNDALDCFDRAVALKSDFAEARANRAPIFLLRGDWARGWSDYEWRWKVDNDAIRRQRRDFTQPNLTGKQPVAGQRVLLVAAQGLGDTLQFCRYAPLLARLGATVILQVPASLAELLRTLEGVAAVYTEAEPLPAFDTHCRITSLPNVFRTTMATIPTSIPYLRISADKDAKWQSKLGERVRRRVGLVWSGLSRPNEQEGWSVLNHRIIPLRALAGLRHPDVDFYSLQKGQPAESELAQVRSARWDGPDIIDRTAELHDFADTAALIAQLDLVISVDTSTAHLAGALGKPVWILLCFDSCWRWLRERTDSPWYPSARLYRQPSPGDWDGVVGQLRQDLHRWAECHGPGERKPPSCRG